jgi:hypothetical protein
MVNKKETWIHKMLKDHNNEPSSKRFVGVLSALILLYCLVHNTLFPNNAPAEYLVDSVALLSFGCLGLTSTEKIFAIIKSGKNSIESKEEEEESEEEKSEEDSKKEEEKSEEGK